MEIRERLSLEEVTAETLSASEHIQRYELAGQQCQGLRVIDLCCGTGYGSAILAKSAREVVGVDYDVATIETAARVTGAANIEFEVADALEFLQRRDVPDRFEAVICFEGLEHLPDVEAALDVMTRLANCGMRLIVSVPNSRTFDEENVFHLTDFDYERALAAFARFPNAVVLHQYLAEGSLICAEPASALAVSMINREFAEERYANHYLFCVNCDRSGLDSRYRARMQLSLAPSYNRYMRNLEVANEALRRRNNQLARGLLGKFDSAAASFVSKQERQIAELTDKLKSVEQERDMALKRVSTQAQEIERLWERVDNAERELKLRADRPLAWLVREAIDRRRTP